MAVGREFEQLLLFQSRVLRELSRAREVPMLLKTCLEAMVSDLPLLCAQAWVLDPQDGLLELRASAGSGSDAPEGSRVLPGYFSSAPPRPDGWAHAFAACPMVFGERVIGVFAVYSLQTLSTPQIMALENVVLTCTQTMVALNSQATLQLGRSNRPSDLECIVVDAATRVKNEFLAKMSHEIRTPLNAILGMAHLTLQTDLNDRQRDYLFKIEKAGENLLRLVNDILDFSQVEAGKLQLERAEMSLDDVIDHLVANLGSKAFEKGLEFLISVSPQVPERLLGDPLRLGQVLIHLLSNAIKFTASGEVSLSIQVAEAPRDDLSQLRLHFLVRDSGVGLSPDQIDRLFVAFSQADSSGARHYGGTGLGLAICDRLVRLMDGEIVVESLPQQGSTFSFTALFETVAAEADNKPGPTLPPGALTRALVIEDHPRARASLVGMLRAISLEVSEVSSAEQAITRLCQTDTPFHVIFLEQALAGALSAQGLCRWLRTAAPLALRATPVVLLTDPSQVELPDAQACLYKPVTRKRVAETVRSLARGSIRIGAPVRPFQERLEGARVLLVEDNLVNQQVAREMMSRAGVQVDGQKAIDMLSSGGPDRWHLVLMDLHMPHLDGYQATEWLRERSPFSRLPIVAMTAHVLPEERQRCIDVGMNDFVPKPIDPKVLFQTLRQWLPEERARFTRSHSLLTSFPLIEGVDVEAGLRRVAGNSVLYRTLLLELVQQSQSTADTLEEALLREDGGRFRMLANTLKGVAGNLGASDFQQQMAQLESLARSQQFEQAALQWPLARAHLSELCQRIEEALAQSGPGGPSSEVARKLRDLSHGGSRAKKGMKGRA